MILNWGLNEATTGLAGRVLIYGGRDTLVSM